MLKYSPPNHPDAIKIPEALKSISETMATINSGISREGLENSKKLIDIEKIIDGDFETLVHPKRIYLREGNLILKPVKSDKGKSEHKSKLHEMFSKKNRGNPYWFLFNDLLLYVEPKKTPQDHKLFDFVTTIQISEITKVDSGQDSSKKEEMVSFRITLMDETFKFETKSVEERNLWMTDLQLLILEKQYIFERKRRDSISRLTTPVMIQ